MNIGAEITKIFNYNQKYSEMIVCFIDVMGIRNRFSNSKNPDEFRMYSTIMNMFADYPNINHNELSISMFSDCMYIITDKNNLYRLIGFLSNMSHRLLFNNVPEIIIQYNKDCFKIRGGITYGNVLSIDDELRKKKIPFVLNILLGPAVVDAYTLESRYANYPRIIVDEKILNLIDEMGEEKQKYYLKQNKKTDDFWYIDFLNYMCQGNRDNQIIFYNLDKCIEFVKKELAEAYNNHNENLTKTLQWYIEYLEEYL